MLLGADAECVAHRFEAAHSANSALTQWSRALLHGPMTTVDVTEPALGFAWVSSCDLRAVGELMESVAAEVRTAKLTQLFNDLESGLRVATSSARPGADVR